MSNSIFTSQLGILFSNIGYALRSLFWKRDRKVILFGSWFGQRFADNPRNLYQYLFEHKDELGLKKVVWVTRNPKVYETMQSMGYEVYMMDSPESIHYHKTAGVHITCDAPYDLGEQVGDLMGQYSYGAVRIYVDHGLGGIKNVMFMNSEYIARKNCHPVLYGVYEYLFRHNSIIRRFVGCRGGWGEYYWMGYSREQERQQEIFYYLTERTLIRSGVPRHCTDVRKTPEEEQVIDTIKAHKYAIMFIPTFRNGDGSVDINMVADGLRDILEANDIVWIKSAHLADTHNALQLNYENNVLTLSPGFDISLLMPLITGLVTDYSSSRQDAMYYHKPVIFFIPDYKEYGSGSRGFCRNIDDYICGIRCTTIEELRDAVVKCIHDPERCKLDNYDSERELYGEQTKDLGQIWQDICRGAGLRY